MRIRRRDLLVLGGVAVLAPLLVSCAVAQDTRKVADYFKDLPHVRSVKDSYDTADADDQVNIDLELDEDVSLDDVAALFSDAEPVLREATQFPVHVTASWSHHGVRMDKCADATYNSSSASDSYDAALLRTSAQGALTAATETARTVACTWTRRDSAELPTLAYDVDHGSGDALPGDVVFTLPPDLALDGYDVFLQQKVVLSGWAVNVTATSKEGAPSVEGAPVAELAAALPPPTRSSVISVGGDSAVFPRGTAIGVVTETGGPEGFVNLGAAAVRTLEGAGWRGVLLVRGTGGGQMRDVLLDTSTSPTSVLSESQAGLGEQMVEGARA